MIKIVKAGTAQSRLDKTDEDGIPARWVQYLYHVLGTDGAPAQPGVGQESC